jgi:glutamate N-acetyltransferase/amino-acid N-acetyltransferase
MTTDTYAKALSARIGEATITWVAKGSGMIEPNMATMLAYIFTDAAIEPATLDHMLRDAVQLSFNMLSVDSDTSTSDTCAILANGRAGRVDERQFFDTLVRRMHPNDADCSHATARAPSISSGARERRGKRG